MSVVTGTLPKFDRRAIGLLEICGFAPATLFLLRRLGGAFLQPLPVAGFAVLTVVALAWSVGLRYLRTSDGERPSSLGDLACSACGTLTVLFFFLASAAPGANLAAALSLCAAIVAAEGWSWLYFLGVLGKAKIATPTPSATVAEAAALPASSPSAPENRAGNFQKFHVHSPLRGNHIEAPYFEKQFAGGAIDDESAADETDYEAEEAEHDFNRESAEDESLDSPDIVQRFVRRMTAEGEDVLEGWLRVPFEAEQRTAIAHAAFCPPFAAEPTLSVEQIEGPQGRLKIAQLLPLGVRIEIKLSSPASAGDSVVVSLLARGPS